MRLENLSLLKNKYVLIKFIKLKMTPVYAFIKISYIPSNIQLND